MEESFPVLPLLCSDVADSEHQDDRLAILQKWKRSRKLRKKRQRVQKHEKRLRERELAERKAEETFQKDTKDLHRQLEVRRIRSDRSSDWNRERKKSRKLALRLNLLLKIRSATSASSLSADQVLRQLLEKIPVSTSGTNDSNQEEEEEEDDDDDDANGRKEIMRVAPHTQRDRKRIEIRPDSFPIDLSCESIARDQPLGLQTAVKAYYSKAWRSIEQLRIVRTSWDMYCQPPIGYPSLYCHFPPPPIPSSAEWAKFLRLSNAK